VILITTKQGVQGQMKVNLDSYFGIKNITSSVPLSGTVDQLYVESIQNRAEGGQNVDALANNPNALFFDTDWADELQVDNASIQNHSLGLSGGRGGLIYNVTGTYFNEQGSLINSGFEKYSLRSNTTFDKGKFRVQTNLGVNIGNQEREPFALIFDALRLPPYRVPLDLDASEFVLGGTNPENITGFAAKLQQESTRENRNLNGNVRIGYEILKGLKLQANLGGSINSNKDRFFAPSTMVFTPEGEFNPVASNLNANLRLTDQTFTSTIAEFTLNYEKRFGDHRINVLAGNTYETREFEFIRTGANFITSNSTPTLSNGEPIIGEQTISNTNSVSWLGRILYSYKQKYMLNAVVRRDGSSNFGINNRYGTFPSISGAWTISEENFWGGLKNFVSFFKIRAGYGTTGSDRIPAFAFNPVVISSVDYIFGIGGTQITPGFTQPGFADPNLQWETNVSKNLGVDLEFWNGKAGLTVELYENDKEDMLLNVIPPVSAGSTPIGGFNRLLTNIGNLQNRGIEIEARYSHSVKGVNLRYSGTFTRNINQVVSLSREGEIIYDGKPNVVRAGQTEPVAALKAGLPVGAFLVYETNGTIKNAEELAVYQQLNAEAKLGDLRYVDANGDGAITIEDRVFRGSYQPEFEYGFNIDAAYKGFDLTVQFFGVQGNTIYNGPKQYTYSVKRHQDLVYSWSPANPTSNVPTPRTEIEHPNVQTSTDFFLEDGSFLRLRNVIFGYSLPQALMKKINVGKIRVYVSAQNPITWTNYTGFDPEVSSSNPFNAGLDQGKYPISAVYRTGLSVVF
ncbi:MAG: SusC/RagA family TonB-linked outer membrane protein, partial [Bacteroidota bacterium]